MPWTQRAFAACDVATTSVAIGLQPERTIADRDRLLKALHRTARVTNASYKAKAVGHSTPTRQRRLFSESVRFEIGFDRAVLDLVHRQPLAHLRFVVGSSGPHRSTEVAKQTVSL